MAGFDGILYPSRFENYPNALIEAMQIGKPVLVSSHGGMPAMIEGYPGGFVTDPLNGPAFENDVCAFAQHLAASPDQASDQEHAARLAFVEIANSNNKLHDEIYAKPLSSVPKSSDAVLPSVAALPSVAFVVTHFRQIEFLGNLFDSLAECLRAGDEVLIVDDASGPEVTAKLTKLAASRGAPFRLMLKQVNEGPGAARADGILNTSADTIQFRDADDRLNSSGFSLARAALSVNPDIDAIFGVVSCFGDMDHYWIPSLADPELAFVRNFSHSSGLFRRAIFERTEGYPRQQLAHFEDWLFNLRFMLAGGRMLVLPCVTLHYRIKQAASRSRSKPAQELHSYQAILDDAFDFARRKDISLSRAALVRLTGQAYLLERGASAPARTTALRPGRYDVADRIVELLWNKPRLLRVAISLANRLLQRKRSWG
jgi:hypothetical protein